MKVNGEFQTDITQKVSKPLASVVGEYFGKYQGTIFEDCSYLTQNITKRASCLLSNIIRMYFSGMDEQQELIFFKATPSTQVKIYFQY